MAAGAAQHVMGPGDGDAVDLAGVGVRFMIDGARSGGGFSLVEHPLAPRTLGSPVHTHSREDEYSYVLEGSVGLLIGEQPIDARPGDLVFKPRGVPHAFWNATDEPARLLEIISPAGFEHFFDELGEQIAAAHAVSVAAVPDVAGLAARYGHYFQPESVSRLCRTHGLRFPGLRDA
jgi:quercetin dioxygenase-like cupin family protein